MLTAGLVDVLVQQGDIEGAHDMLAKVYEMQLEQAQLSQEDPAVLATTARSASIMLAERKYADAVQCYQSVSIALLVGAAASGPDRHLQSRQGFGHLHTVQATP